MHIPFNCLETLYFITFKKKVNRIWYKSGQTHKVSIKFYSMPGKGHFPDLHNPQFPQRALLDCP